MKVWVCSANSDGTMRSIGYYDAVKVVDSREKADAWQRDGGYRESDVRIQEFEVE